MAGPMEDQVYDQVNNRGCEPQGQGEVIYRPSSKYMKMLNNIINDLDLLSNEMCDLYPYTDTCNGSTGPGITSNGGTSSQTCQDCNPGRGEDSAFGTLASTDSFCCEPKMRSDSMKSNHLEVFALDTKGLEIPTVNGDNKSLSSTDSGHRRISFHERLTKTHPIWYLPDIGRSGAVHLLKDRDSGNFIIRNSSQQQDALALSVQFPENGASSVDHYLIMKTEEGFMLQGSKHCFPSLPDLLDHYHAEADELPGLLTLPPTIMRAPTSQELTSLSYLGQDFWTSYRFDRKGLSAGSSDSLHSSGEGVLHKSASEPICIQLNTKSSIQHHFKSKTAFLQSFFKNKNAPSATSSDSGSKDNLSQSPSLTEVSRFTKTPPLEQFSGGHNTDVVVSSSDVSSNSSSFRIHSNRASVSPVLHEHASLLKKSLHNSMNLQEQPVHKTFQFVKEQSPSNSSTPESSAYCEKCGSSLSSRTHTDESSSSANFSDHVQSNERLVQAQVPKTTPQKSNLYSTTQLDLLQIPENQYFRSNLSDKMSDYEDIWKNSSLSATPAPSVKGSEFNSPLLSAGSTGFNFTWSKGGNPDNTPAHINLNNFFPPHQNSSNIPKNFTSSVRNGNSCDIIPTSTSVSPTDMSHLANKLAVKRAFSLDESQQGKASSILRIPLNEVSGRCMSEQVIDKPKASVQTQTSPIMPKSKPPDLTLKENNSVCSKNSTNSSMKSPVYAEPFDSLEPHKVCDVNKAPRIRRSSMPVMGYGVNSRKMKTYSMHPPLETIQSPGCERKEMEKEESAEVVGSSGLHRINSSKSDSRCQFSVLNRENLNDFKKRLQDIKLNEKQSNVPQAEKPNVPEKPKVKVTKRITQETKVLKEIENAQQTWDYSSSTLQKFPVLNKQVSSASTRSEYTTMEDIISNEHPGYTIRPIPIMPQPFSVLSEYDNLTGQYAPPSQSRLSTGTEFCRPWDKTFVNTLLTSNESFDINALSPPMNTMERIEAWQAHNSRYSHPMFMGSRDSMVSSTTVIQESDEDNHSVVSFHSPKKQHPIIKNNKHETDTDVDDSVSVAVHAARKSYNHPPAKAQQFQHPVVYSTSHKHPDAKIRDFISKLSQDRNNTFGSTIFNFIQCTVESSETNPQIVTRNVRQFMTGIRNYLVKHELEDVVEAERRKLKPNEILNVDSLIERSLHQCVLKPLKEHIYRLFVNEHNKNGNLKKISDNIKYARTKTTAEIGLRPGMNPPDRVAMELIKQNLVRMQKTYSPLKKLEHLLGATSIIYKCSSSSNGSKTSAPMGADDFLPMLIYVLVHCGMVTAEIEVDYIWGLIHPTLLSGESGYYLTTLSSAMLVLKNFKEMQEANPIDHEGHLPSVNEIQGFLKVAMPSELHDNIAWKTLPIRPKMNARDVCALIAHKFKVTNPQDYGLYVLIQGEETKLKDSEIPKELKAEYQAACIECEFAYKRNLAKIAWPVSFSK